MKQLLPLCVTVILAGCAAGQSMMNDGTTTASGSSLISTSTSSSQAEDLPIERVPSELSIPHFRDMRLSGTGLVLESVLDRTDAYVRHAISYRSNGLRITGIMNIPHGNGPFPLVILNHGYIDPAIYTQGRGLRREQNYLVRNGFAVLHTDYRGHAGSDKGNDNTIYDAGLEYAMDSANAINAVRAAKLPQVDSERVGMLGHSLGGGVTLAVLTGKPDLVDAAVLYAPVHADVWENFLRWRDEGPEGMPTKEKNGTRETNPEFWAQLSPETFLGDIRAPVLLFHGDRDADVPKSWSDHLNQRLTELQKDITYVEYPGEGHEFGPQWGDFMAKTVEFLRENL